MRLRAAWPTALSIVLLCAAIAVFLRIHSFEEMSPTISPENQQLFKFVMSCPVAETWKVDFEGNGFPYAVERKRCTSEQLKSTPAQPRLRLGRAFDFVLVEQHRAFRHIVVAGWDCDGECPGTRQFKFSGRPVLLLTTVPAGSGQYDQWCILGWMGDYLGCWHLPDEATYKRRVVDPDEMMHALHPRVEDGKLVFSAVVGGPNEGNCCPTHGWVHIVLTPGDGDFTVERIYRTPSAPRSR